jgi:hypothetical protein
MSPHYTLSEMLMKDGEILAILHMEMGADKSLVFLSFNQPTCREMTPFVCIRSHTA